MPSFKEAVEGIGLVIDGAGVLVIVVGLVVAPVRFAAFGRRTPEPYRRLRQDLGQGILLGLIVLIRTVLSMALEVELEGRWPWQRANETGPVTTPDA